MATTQLGVTLSRVTGRLLALVLLASCSNGGRKDKQPCPRGGSTFRVQITSDDGELPADTSIQVSYGSNTEGFDFRHQNGANQDVCCRGVSTVSTELDAVPCVPADAGRIRAPAAIECELTTNGAARLTVTASGYPALEQTLEAERLEGEEWEHCDVLLTRDVFVELVRGDAGP